MQMIRRAELARKFGMTGQGFTKMVQRTPDFPKPLKVGDHRQSAVLYSLQEVEAWVEEKKATQQAKGH